MASQELSSVVDEEDEDRRASAQTQAAQDTGFDWDKICAYKTLKIVRIKDRSMGLLYWFIVLTVILYITNVALILRGQHMEQEQGIGTVITRFHGKGFDGDMVFDEADLRFPVIEPTGAFIMTRSIVQPGQKVGQCVDWDEPKRCPCHEGEECIDDFCSVNGWCPSMGDKNVDNPPEGAIEHRISGLQYTILEIMSGITFPSLATDKFFVTGNSGLPDAVNKFRNVTIKDLLKEVGPEPLLLEDITEIGALIGVSFFWNCDVNAECEPMMVVKRLDKGQGFVQKRVRHGRSSDGEVTRDAVYMYGIRVLVDSSGIGKKFSLMLMIIQIGSGLALLRTAAMAADFFMLYLRSAQLTENYYKCKVKETQDYSDLQDRINLIKQQQENEGEMVNRKAANTSLGLGAGGRGGNASSIMKGRKY